MKHIKKRFQFEIHLTDEMIQNMENVFEFLPVSSMATKRPQKGQECILLTEKNLGIKAFHININGVNHFIPEPDPILVYFHNAYTNFINIKEAKQKVLGVLNQTNLDEDISIVLYCIHILVIQMGMLSFFLLQSKLLLIDLYQEIINIILSKTTAQKFITEIKFNIYHSMTSSIR